MDIVVVGHVDHGKSTVVGRLLADTHSLPEGRLAQVRASCERNSRPFEYAFLLDTLKDEQSQGITIDAARIFFNTKRRKYTIIDAPGHIEFLKNMVTGASRAEAALLVIDAKEGIGENSRRHGYLLSMLGVNQIVVLINKMDLLQYREKAYEDVKHEYFEFLQRLGVKPHGCIPVAGLHGDNIVGNASAMPWYRGPSVIETLDSFETRAPDEERPFRMPVQDVYKFTRGGDDRRIVAGTIESGTLRVKDTVVFYPSGKKSTVKSIEHFNRPPRNAALAKEAVGFTLEEQIFISRGEIATLASEPKPSVTTQLRVGLFWLGKEPMSKRKAYLLKLGTTRVTARLVKIQRLMDTSTLNAEEGAEEITTNSMAECILKLDQAIAVDTSLDFQGTGRFVIVDQFDISGGGLVREALRDDHASLRERVILRNMKWEQSIIPSETRAERYNQRATLILLTSARNVERKGIAKKLEKDLFGVGRITYFLAMGNAIYGVGAEIKDKNGSFDENLRRFSELVNVLLDAGILVIGTVAELTQENLEVIKASIDPDRTETIWLGEEVTTNLAYDARIYGESEAEIVNKIRQRLQDRGLIFKPW